MCVALDPPQYSDCVMQTVPNNRAGLLPLVIAGAMLLASHGAGAQTSRAAPPPTHAETPTFQGHDAESRMRDPADETRHRALFFDGVDLEIGPPGLSCDHLVARKPQAIAGRGYVVIFAAREAETAGKDAGAGAPGTATPRHPPARRATTVRVWQPPESAATLEAARAQAREAAHARLPGATLTQTDAKEFWWCK